MQLPAHADPDKIGSIFELIDSQLGQVKEVISSCVLGDASSTIRNTIYPVRNSIFSGKMLRPGLVLLSYRVVRDASLRLRSGQACEKKTQYDIRNTQYEAIRVAAIVEIIHNATLLHDDVIDEGQKRRGLPTINSLCGNESAVLLGDFLLSRVFKMCADLEPRVTEIIAATTARTCEGELRQIIQKWNWHLSESEYIDIITEKSAVFFSSCCELGGLLAEANETQLRSLADFGRNVGIAFQITDDLLDIIGEETQTGKTLGSDVDKNKLTLAVIHLLTVVDEGEKNTIISSFVKREAYLEGDTKCEILRRTPNGGDTRNDKMDLAEMLQSYGSLEYVRSRAQEFVTKAIGALAGLKESDAKEALIETAKFVASRAGDNV